MFAQGKEQNTVEKIKHQTSKIRIYHLNSFLHLEASATQVMLTPAWHHSNVPSNSLLALMAMQLVNNTINVSPIAGFKLLSPLPLASIISLIQNGIDKTEEIMLSYPLLSSLMKYLEQCSLLRTSLSGSIRLTDSLTKNPDNLTYLIIQWFCQNWLKKSSINP